MEPRQPPALCRDPESRLRRAGFEPLSLDALRKPPLCPTQEQTTGLVASCYRAASVLRDDLEPTLRNYEGGELTAILEAATELREQLEVVAREINAERDGAEEYPTPIG